MQPYGYQLSGNAHNTAPDYYPSLIGVGATQIAPGADDTYFEAHDLPAGALDITAVTLTRWVSYDSLPASVRDPIVAVKAGEIGYYHTLSELTTMLEAAGAAQALVMVKRLRPTAV